MGGVFSSLFKPKHYYIHRSISSGDLTEISGKKQIPSYPSSSAYTNSGKMSKESSSATGFGKNPSIKKKYGFIPDKFLSLDLALLEYDKNKMRNGELPFSDNSLVEPFRVENQVPGSRALGSGRARRDAAARAIQGWHSQRLLGNGEDKNLNSAVNGDKQQKTNGLLKRKKPSSVESGVNVPPIKSMRMDSMVVDAGPPADWVKINVQKTSDCYEICALVPGLLREEVHVQSDPTGRLIIYGEPQQLDNPWGVTAFKKVVNLPSRIDPHQTYAVVTLHGQLFVLVPFEQLDS